MYYTADVRDRESTSGMVVRINGTPVAWHCKKQGSLAHSTSEAEYMRLSQHVKEVVWLRGIQKEVKIL